jgi:hypothetical protein
VRVLVALMDTIVDRFGVPYAIWRMPLCEGAIIYHVLAGTSSWRAPTCGSIWAVFAMSLSTARPIADVALRRPSTA